MVEEDFKIYSPDLLFPNETLSPWHNLIISPPMYSKPSINLPKRFCYPMRSFFLEKSPPTPTLVGDIPDISDD